MKFKSVLKRERKAQTFDPEHLTKTAQGEISVYDKIQAARVDTEIYPTLEKYGSIDRIKLDAKKVYGDFTAFKDLRSMLDQQIAAKKMWEALPWDVRKKFDNNIHTFIKDGEKYLQEEIKKQQPAEVPQSDTPAETKGE